MTPETWDEYFALPWYKRWITPVPDDRKITRNTTLEEAAKVAETWPEWDDSAGHPWDTVAAAIRALKSPVSEGGE